MAHCTTLKIIIISSERYNLRCHWKYTGCITHSCLLYQAFAYSSRQWRHNSTSTRNVYYRPHVLQSYSQVLFETNPAAAWMMEGKSDHILLRALVFVLVYELFCYSKALRKAKITQCIGGWVNPRARLEALEKRHSTAPIENRTMLPRKSTPLSSQDTHYHISIFKK